MNACTARRPRPLPHQGKRSSTEIQALQRRNALVEAHRHLVPPVAHHYWLRCPEPQDDLVQVGLMGLIRAAELFCPETKTPFSAFARPHIRGAILHYLRDTAAPVRLPRRQAELQSRLQRVEKSGWAGADGQRCTPEPLTEEQRQLLQQHRQLCRPAPLDQALLEQIASPASDPLMEEPRSQRHVDELLKGLDPRTQQVLRGVVLQGWSYRRTAAALNVSTMTVQRCLHSGLARLRNQLCPPTQKLCLNSGRRRDRAPSVAPGWPLQPLPLPAGVPTHRARR